MTRAFPSARALAIVAIAGAACHRGSARPTPVEVESGVLGDTAAFGPRILGFNGIRTTASYALAAPAHVVLLAVLPGNTVELIERGQARDTAMTPAGVHETRVEMPRAPVAQSEPRLIDQNDYRRCVDQQVRARTRRKPTRRIVRDSAGRTVEVAGPAEVEVPLDAEREAERACAGILKRTRPTPPPDGDRFLLLIASDVRLTPAELRARLDAMTVTASDVPTTIAAIAEALYFDRKAAWAGYFTRW